MKVDHVYTSMQFMQISTTLYRKTKMQALTKYRLHPHKQTYTEHVLVLIHTCENISLCLGGEHLNLWEKCLYLKAEV